MIGANHKCAACEVGWSDVIGRRCWNCGTEGRIGTILAGVIVPPVWPSTHYQADLPEQEAARIVLRTDVAAQVTE